MRARIFASLMLALSGDPRIAPIVDRYRVGKNTHRIELYDVVSDRWLRYATLSARPASCAASACSH